MILPDDLAQAVDEDVDFVDEGFQEGTDWIFDARQQGTQRGVGRERPFGRSQTLKCECLRQPRDCK